MAANMTAASLDRRLNAFRSDLADIRLGGQVEADKFVEGRPCTIRSGYVNLKPRPASGAGTDTQMLLGDHAHVFEQRDGWAWIQSLRDDYVGYVPTSAIRQGHDVSSHWVNVPRTFVYAQADMKTPPVATLSIGSQIAVTGSAETRGTLYAALAGGRYVVSNHICAVQDLKMDFVTVAENLLRTPYLWGGASAFGIDCSGLISLSMKMAGQDVLRDSDMQAAAIGSAISGEDLQRGDLVFWKGHAGIMLGSETLLHANGHSMDVACEPFRDAVARIGYLYGQPTAYRRPKT